MGVVKIGTVTIYTGDCPEVLPEIPGVSGVLTDPPYGLSFMGGGRFLGVPGIPVLGCHRPRLFTGSAPASLWGY